MGNFKYTSQKDYKTIIFGSEDANSAVHQRLIADLKNQRPLHKYRVPQAILEYIDPKWVVRYKIIRNTREQEDKMEKFLNRFRW